jgi:hypothetical protein
MVLVFISCVFVCFLVCLAALFNCLSFKASNGTETVNEELGKIWIRFLFACLQTLQVCIQKFPDWPPGARTANGTALCH